ncbi:hypothetical protein [Pseudothermotoga elfii]
MKLIKLLFFVFSFFVVTSCVESTITQIDTDLIRYIAVAYNRGHNLSLEEISNLISEISYDDDVLINYMYFVGKINLEELLQQRKEPSIYDERIVSYLKSTLSENGSSELLIIDHFDENIPVEDPEDFLNPEARVNDSLSERVYELIKYDYFSKAMFYQWYKKFYDEELSESQIRKFAEFLVKIAEGYSSLTVKKISQVDSEFFLQEVDLGFVPTELVLAIAYEESRFFPASFRSEISDDIYAISLGLTHILLDADSLDISSQYSDIGDGNKQYWTFELLALHYFEGFSGEDLLQIRSAFLFARTYLSLIKCKIELELCKQ